MQKIRQIPLFSLASSGDMPRDASEYFEEHRFAAFSLPNQRTDAIRILHLLCGVEEHSIRSNEIQILEDPTFPSDTVSDIPWHQEDYHLEDRPSFLAFRCISAGQHGEGTQVLAAHDILCALAQRSLHCDDYEIRFQRLRDVAWTDWYPLVTLNGTRGSLRYAQPDGRFRNVEIRSLKNHRLCPDVLSALEECLGEVPCHIFSGRQAEMLLLDNFATLHARPELSPDSGRRLERLTVRSR